MGRLKPAGMLTGLVGNALIGVALFQLIQAGECGDLGQQACPDGLLPYVLALPVGILVSVVAVFLGGGLVVFSGIFLAVGLGAMAASAFGDAEETKTFGWVFGGMFAAFGLAPLMAAAALEPLGARRLARARQLMATGGQGVGTVIDVRDTGVTVNDDPRVEITMRVAPADGSPPFERSRTVTVPRIAIPRAGDRFPVVYDREDADRWAFGSDVEAAASPVTSVPESMPAPAAGPLDQLAKLNDLRLSGALTDEEFAVAKDRLLARLGGASP